MPARIYEGVVKRRLDGAIVPRRGEEGNAVV
jgi:hypothetical protein